jgi:uncharacterized protein involved in outer membrane biogenesis
MKIIKRILIGLAVFIVLVVSAAIILPIVFKDDIKAAIDKQLAKSINADVVFDVNNFSLTVFKNFPNMTVEIKELGVFNHAPFEGTPLFVTQRFGVELNLKDVLFGNEIRIKGITLERPQITVKVLKDGQANYNITFPDSSKVVAEPTAEPSKFSFGIDHWEIIDGEVVYDDQSLTYYLQIKGLNHTGSGDFTQDVFDLKTHTVADTVTTYFGPYQLLTDKRAEIDGIISVSENISKFTFKENKVKVNDFAISADGWFKMNPDNFDMDIAFKSPDNSFKSLLSIVPGVYTKDFGKIETKGDLAFSGLVKGIYTEKQMPAFNVDLKVKDAMFKYPQLPTAINNINMELLIDNKDGVIANTVVDLKKLHLDFGSNPVDASLLIENLRNFKMNATLKAALNLGELTKMFPMEGMELRGIYSINAKANGVYDSIKKIIPAINASMTLADGYAKTAKFPLPLEQVKMSASVVNTSGKMAETLIKVDNFSMLLDGEKLEATLTVQNLDDYTWALRANGGVDLEKMTKIFPLAGMTLAGKLKANLETRGKMSDVTAKRFEKLPTSGTAAMKDFKFTSKDLPYAVTISQADVTLDPQKIALKQMTGTIGRSDFSVTGLVSNYIGFVLNKETIKGKVNFNSTLLDLNEFMPTTASTTTTGKDTTSLKVATIPENIDFTFSSDIKTVKMMEYTMTNGAGDILVKDGIVNMNGLRFNMLGGAFGVTGSYNPKDVKHPKYDFALKIENLSVQQAATSFSIVKTYAPVAGLVTGNFNTDFKITGELLQNMMPNLNSVNGGGLIKIAEAAVKNSKLVSGITALTKLNDTDNISLKDVLMSAAISNGRLSVKPFDVKFGSYVTTISGSSGLDQSIDYTLKMNVPASSLGGQFQGLFANSSGMIPLTIGVGGTFKNPKTALVTTEQKQQVKEAVTKAVETKAQEAVKEVLSGEKPQDVVKNILNSVTKPDTAKVKDSTKTEAPAPVVDQLQNKLQNLLKRKKN